jgi:hypothetical protein
MIRYSDNDIMQRAVKPSIAIIKKTNGMVKTELQHAPLIKQKQQLEK